MQKSIKIFYDTETTGTNHKKHSIIQLSGIVEIDNQVVDTFDYLMAPHPKAEIDAEALQTNGRTEEEIRSFPLYTLVFQQFKEKVLRKYINQYNPKEKALLIGYNNRGFDDFFLRYLFELCGDNFIGSFFWNDTVDVLCLASQYFHPIRHCLPSFKLKRIATELGIELDKDKLHDGLYDAELTRRIYRRILGLESGGPEDMFYYYHPESDDLFKSFDEIDPGEAQQIDWFRYRNLLDSLGLKDGPDRIFDDLML